MAFGFLTSDAVQEQSPGSHSDPLVEPQVLGAPRSGVSLATKHHGRHIVRAESQAFVQGSAKRRSPGLVNLVPAVAYLICLALAAAFTQPGAHLLSEPCSLTHRA